MSNGRKMSSRGCYSLILRIWKPTTVKIGALGYVKFDEGLYVYVGSAMGSKAQNLENRVRRHLSRCKKAKWHIDFLLSCGDVSVEKVIMCRTVNNMECSVVREVAKIGLHNPRLKGFGSSDCRFGCFSHIVYLGSLMTIDEAVTRILNAYGRLSLRPEVFKSEDLRGNC